MIRDTYLIFFKTHAVIPLRRQTLCTYSFATVYLLSILLTNRDEESGFPSGFNIDLLGHQL